MQTKYRLDHLPAQYDSSDYGKLCQAITKREHPKDQWLGAVVCLICEDHFIFIKRSQNMPTHKGQLALVGGNRGPNESPLEVARREFSEETGISDSHLEIAGLLPPVLTGRQKALIPVVANLEMSLAQFKSVLGQSFEWSVALACPLGPMSRPESWSYATRYGAHTVGAILFRELVCSDMVILGQSEGEKLPEAFVLWGATARIIWNFFQITSLQNSRVVSMPTKTS